MHALRLGYLIDAVEELVLQAGDGLVVLDRVEHLRQGLDVDLQDLPALLGAGGRGQQRVANLFGRSLETLLL